MSVTTSLVLLNQFGITVVMLTPCSVWYILSFVMDPIGLLSLSAKLPDVAALWPASDFYHGLTPTALAMSWQALFKSHMFVKFLEDAAMPPPISGSHAAARWLNRGSLDGFMPRPRLGAVISQVMAHRSMMEGTLSMMATANVAPS
ncbi:MAG: hypothetical protein BYD32DRAFT_467025 [Podila humilis]|nr:MAG: hypothetical protein BYD32DRAFT_467025 [Podila humilis]